jgi:hypothetical protein
MSTLLTILGTAVIAAPVGFFVCAVLSHGRVQDAIAFWEEGDGEALDKLRAEVAEWVDHAAFAANEATAAQAAYDRASDALGGAQRKLSAIRDLLDTPRTIRKADLRDVLDGERG